MIKFLITKGGDTTVNVETPNKPFINGFRTVVDRNEGWTYFMFLALYDESMGTGFESAYKYPALVLRMQCELGESPASGNHVQYAFGDWSESQWNQDGTDWDDATTLVYLKMFKYNDIDTVHRTISRIVFDTVEGMTRNYVFEVGELRDQYKAYHIPFQITEVRTSNGDDMVTHSYIYRITENVDFGNIERDWSNILSKGTLTK